MAKKHRHPEHVNHERWLVSYADFITLLFAFFVVMFAASNADQQKAGKVAKAVEVAFSELSIFDPSGKVVPMFDDGGLPGTSHQLIGNVHGGFENNQIVQTTSGSDKSGASKKQRGEMAVVEEHLRQVLKQELGENQITVAEDFRGITISLNENGFFSAGSAVLDPRSRSAIRKIADTVKGLNASIRIEGHTDDRPIKTAQFPSNWELSTSRATNILRYLIVETGIGPDRMSAVGYGEYRPVASNGTAEGRARNRRVDIVVLNSISQRNEPRPAVPAAEETVGTRASPGVADPRH